MFKLAEYPKRLHDLGDDVYGTEMWHETNAQKDGTIRRETCFPRRLEDLILSGPHFYVGNPLNKTPRAVCNTKAAYDLLDLETLADDYIPRTNYLPACPPLDYLKRTPKFKGEPVTNYYRHVHRRMLSITGERTLVGGLIPPSRAHSSCSWVCLQ